MLPALALLLAPRTAGAGEARTGEQIFRAQCAACHGLMGEGTDDNYPHALQGSRTVEQLSRLIARTMPKKAPQKCPPEDAEKVAAYIHEAFYSAEARERNKPPRVELSRLTVRQYRHAVADLIGSFRGATKPDERCTDSRTCSIRREETRLIAPSAFSPASKRYSRTTPRTATY